MCVFYHLKAEENMFLGKERGLCVHITELYDKKWKGTPGAGTWRPPVSFRGAQSMGVQDTGQYAVSLGDEVRWQVEILPSSFGCESPSLREFSCKNKAESGKELEPTTVSLWREGRWYVCVIEWSSGKKILGMFWQKGKVILQEKNWEGEGERDPETT